MSTIVLEQLKVNTIIGVFEWEKRMPQDVMIDLEMEFDTSKAALSDDIADTLNYKDVAKCVLPSFSTTNTFALIETLAEKLASLLLEKYALEQIKVSISKPMAVRGSKNVKVIVRKTA
ncbi:MAG: dihydroneopterin aldolase [Candidatus Oxydemutatoraceae bacterium WSBS_2016_MAG_OTU14]